MNRLLRPRICPSFRASSGVDPCDVPFRYASGPTPRYRGTVARWHAHLRGLATAIHEISGLDAVYSEIYGAERLPRQVIITYQPFLTTIVLEKTSGNIIYDFRLRLHAFLATEF